MRKIVYLYGKREEINLSISSPIISILPRNLLYFIIYIYIPRIIL